MIKTNADNFWVNLEIQKDHRGTVMFVDKWLNNTNSVLRYCLIVSNRIVREIISLFTLHEQRKARLQRIKDEFYFGSHAGGKHAARNAVPRRTWKRHSALLFYREELLHSQQMAQVIETERHSESEVEQQAAARTRMSFKVKSIRMLPVWSSGLGDMSSIEDDLSSLRFLEVRSLTKYISEAA